MSLRRNTTRVFVTSVLSRFVEVFTDQQTVEYFALQKLRDEPRQDRHKYKIFDCNLVPDDKKLSGIITIKRSDDGWFKAVLDVSILDVSTSRRRYAVGFALTT